MLPFRFKIFLYIITACVFTLACSKKEIMPQYKSFEELSSKVSYTALKDTLFNLSEIDVSETYKDSLLFFTEHFTNGIFKYVIKDNSLSMITKTGPGPGEFQRPGYIVVSGNELIINDDSRWDNVQKFDFNGNYLGKIISKYAPTLRSMCMDSRSNIYFVTAGPYNNYYIHDINNNQYNKVPECINNFEYSISQPGAFIYDDILYFMNPYEYKVYTLDTRTKKEDVIYLTGLKNVVDFEQYYDQILPVKVQLRLVTKDFKYKYVGFKPFIINGKLIFVLGVIEDSLTDNRKPYTCFYDKSGNAIFSVSYIQPDKSAVSPLYFYKNTLVCSYKKKTGSDLTGFVRYELKEDILKLFK